MAIEETKLTPEILNAFCRLCAEGCPEEPHGEDCFFYKECLDGCFCDEIIMTQSNWCPCEDTDENGTPVCEAYESEIEIDEHGNESRSTSYNVFKCITCALKTGYIKP